MGGRGGASPSQRQAPAAAPSSSGPDVPAGATAAEQALINAYWDAVRDNNISNQTDKWVRLPDIRQRLDNAGVTSREQQDAALRALAVREDVRMVPVANLKSLSQADRNAAIRLGGQDVTAMLMYSRAQMRSF